MNLITNPLFKKKNKSWSEGVVLILYKNLPTAATDVVLSGCTGLCVFLDVHLLLYFPQFSVFLGLIFFLELTAGVLAFVFKDWIKDQLNLFINNNVKAYRDDIDLQNLIDFAQEYVSTRRRMWLTVKMWNCSDQTVSRGWVSCWSFSVNHVYNVISFPSKWCSNYKK